MMEECRICGCWEMEGCFDESTGEECFWAEGDLCSVCAKIPVPWHEQFDGLLALREAYWPDGNDDILEAITVQETVAMGVLT